jgi:hypothetical protein
LSFSRHDEDFRRGLLVRSALSQSNVRRSWMKVTYFVALAIAMMGWLWLVVWLARHLI